MSALALPAAAHAEAAEVVEVFVTLDAPGLYAEAAEAGSVAAYMASEAGQLAMAEAAAELDALGASVEAIGGEVMGQSWLLSRALGVRIAAGRLDALAALDGVAAVERVGLRYAPTAAEENEAAGDGAVEPLYAPDLLGLDSLHAGGVLGEGVLVAVIDTGFDLEHEAFVMPEGVKPAMTAADLAAMLPTLSFAQYFGRVPAAETFMHGDKVAFAYDYIGDDTDVSATDIHGTHVASILAGGADTNGEFIGVAPAAQLALMKVFSDGATPVASEYAVYRAVEDAVMLGADIISLSLGATPGYAYATNTFSLYRHLEQARELGCVVVCAMGNDGGVGAGSYYDSEREIDFPLAANPDYGLTADPASYASTLAVGAYTPMQVLESGLGAGDGELFAYSDSAAGQGFDEMKFVDVLAGQTLEYVTVPGLGAAADYIGLDVAGKLALVERGEITFTEKLAAAHAAGAIGMLCYNNAGGDDFSMAFDAMPIPAVAISREDGLHLKGLPKGQRRVTVSDDLMRLTVPEGAGQPASYTTVSSGLIMRPTVVAPGSIYAAVPGGGYRTVSGTSMATPTVAGLCALALGNGRKITGGKDVDALLADLITTATPIEDESGHPYPIRVQGGGAIDPAALLAVKTSLRAADGRGLIELGDGLAGDGRFTLEVELTNPAKTAQRYRVTASVGSDDYFLLDEEGVITPFAADRAHLFTEAALLLDGVNCNRYGGEGASVYTLTLGAGETRKLAISVTLSAAEAAEYAQYFVNGYYLEGYVWAEAIDDEEAVIESLTLPYLGFAGDFDALPYLDVFGYDGGRSFFAQNYLFAEANKTALNLGCSYYDEAGVFRSDLIAFSPDGDGWLDLVQMNLCLLRNLYSFEMEITDEAGKSVQKAKRAYYLTKAFAQDDDTLASTLLRVWDGSDQDNASYIMPDGRYTVTLRVFGPGDVVLEEASLPIVLDTKPVEIVSTKLTEENGVRKLSVTLRDDHYPMRAVLYRTEVDKYGREVDLYRDAHNISYREGRRAITLIYDITGFAGEYLYLDLYDYAMNRETHKIEIVP